ncbi:MAG: formate/nitrite transporter family protein [Bacteroidales bacterium]|nr:formate/nitrite transporter family protein [Bacteroidales bacterium]
MRHFSEVLRSAVLAGICIAIGGFVFLATSGNAALKPYGAIIGAVFFLFGLITIVHFRYKLYTGAVGFATVKCNDLCDLGTILLGNVIGCLLVALAAKLSPLGLEDTAARLLESRLATGALRCGVLAIGCGFIVTASVVHGRNDHWLPMLFGIPTFIICGFPHCIADAFYYLAAPFSLLADRCGEVILLYVAIVAGNTVGCNLYRWILPESK